jgi:hypothetical protein
MLNLYNNTGCRFDICPMHFTVVSDVRNFPAICREHVFPFAMPRCLIFPPGIAVVKTSVRPMMDYAIAALGDHIG